jgi:hypothetical protein
VVYFAKNFLICICNYLVYKLQQLVALGYFVAHILLFIPVLGELSEYPFSGELRKSKGAAPGFIDHVGGLSAVQGDPKGFDQPGLSGVP